MNGFKLASEYSRKEGYGGVAVYLREDLHFTPQRKVNELSSEEVFECACVDFTLNGKTIVVAAVYRAPKSDINIFFKKLELFLEKTVRDQRKILIAGDFNIELLKPHGRRTRLLSLMTSFGMQPTVFENTRITPFSESCIDNIFINTSETDVLCSHVVSTCISDHTAQGIALPRSKDPSKPSYFRRFFTEPSKKDFLLRLSTEEWLDLFDSSDSDVNAQWTAFMRDYTLAFNEAFPRKLVDPMKKPRNKNWYKNNVKILESKKRLDILLMLKRKSNSFNEMY